jgi:hypothetical protein
MFLFGISPAALTIAYVSVPLNSCHTGASSYLSFSDQFSCLDDCRDEQLHAAAVSRDNQGCWHGQATHQAPQKYRHYKLAGTSAPDDHLVSHYLTRIRCESV